MTTNILIAIGVFWAASIATTAELVVTVAVCKYIDKHVANDGLDFLATVATVFTAVAVTAILWISVCSFLSDLFPGQLPQ